MSQTCPHCGVEQPEDGRAYCLVCREDLSVTPEEAEETQPTFAKMGEALEPARIAWGGIVVAIGTLSSVAALLTGLVRSDWKAAGFGAIGLAVCAFWAVLLYRSAVVKTSVTKSGNPFTDQESEEAK